jgi:prolyl-tRNA synthetase
VRWELRPRLFLRTSEFLWQEGHTAHTSQEDAAAYARRILREVYEDVMVNVLAIPVLVGRKTASERFAGAINTMTCEGLMRDGKALQLATSHELGINFAKAFDITYLDDQGATQHCWTTSWGSTTRMIGGLIMTHGDDAGLVVPPQVAATQVVVLLVKDEAGAGDTARALAADLGSAGVRVVLDDKVSQSFGRRSTDWELKGVPLRVEVGPRDLAEGQVTVVRRDRAEKQQVPLSAVAGEVDRLLSVVQKEMLARAAEERDARTVDVDDLDAAAEAAQTGVARLPWALVGDAGEARLAERGVTVRCLQRADGGCPESDDEDDIVAFVARAY